MPISPKKGYIYLLREREFINNGRKLYKIGRTGHHVNQRLGKYPKDSELFIVIQVDDQLVAEATLLKKFRKEFDNRDEIGAEYFEGDLTKMKEIIIKYSLGDWSCFEDSDLESEMELPTPSDQGKSATELREECRKLGLATRGTKEQLTKKLDLYHSIENLPIDTVKTLANSHGIKLSKQGNELRLEYVKRFLGTGVRKLGSSTTKSDGEGEGQLSEEPVPLEKSKLVDEFSELQRKFGILEADIRALQEQRQKLEEDLKITRADVMRLEALVGNLVARIDLVEKNISK